MCAVRACPGSHRNTKFCREGTERRCQREAAVKSALALSDIFTAYGEPLERVEAFKYLGRLLAFDNNDRQAMRSNLKKA